MNWFEIDDCPDRIFRLREPNVRPLDSANIWLVVGRNAALLIDTGLGVVSLRREIEQLTDKPIICVATHSHFDHIGGAYEFADRRMHAAEASILSDPSAQATLWAGWLTPASFKRAPSEDFDFPKFHIRAAPVTKYISDNDMIDLGDRQLRVLHTPGHSPGLVCIFEESSGTLFSSDALYDGEMFFDLRGSNKTSAISSISKLAGTQAKIVHPGHYQSFANDKLQSLASQTIANLK